jgi:hypothetical protein
MLAWLRSLALRILLKGVVAEYANQPGVRAVAKGYRGGWTIQQILEVLATLTPTATDDLLLGKADAALILYHDRPLNQILPAQIAEAGKVRADALGT